MRKAIYETIETGENREKANRIYVIVMTICIVCSLIPLAFKEETQLLQLMDKVTVTVFIIDYILRLFTADYKYNQGTASFIKYPFSPMAIIDLISILPSLTILNQAFKALRIFRMARITRSLRLVKTVRAAKFARFSNTLILIINVVKKSKYALLAVAGLAIGYILVTGLIIFNVEPDTFNNYFEAVYWATVSLTTVGYGDIYSVTTTGRLISMISSFVGIAVVALPSGIVTAEFVRELNEKDNSSDKKEVEE